MSRFADLIRETRQRRGWTQQELADRAGVGRKTIVRWEAGETTPDPWQVRAVASALGIATEEAFQALGWLEPSPKPPPQPATYEERKAALFEVLRPEDRATVQEVLELAEALIEKRERERREAEQAERSTGS